MILTFAPEHNSDGKRDASHAFIPEARAFCRLHRAPLPVLFDNRLGMSDRLHFVCESIERLEDMDEGTLGTLALFCHGWKDGLQIGVRARTACVLAGALRRVTTDVRIILYCCDAGRDADDERVDDRQPGPGGDGGFADKLREELRVRGVRSTIYAHTTAGHTTRNPYVRRFDPDEMAGGRWVVEPRSQEWTGWVSALRHGPLRLRFPFMSDVEILHALKHGEGNA